MKMDTQKLCFCFVDVQQIGVWHMMRTHQFWKDSSGHEGSLELRMVQKDTQMREVCFVLAPLSVKFGGQRSIPGPLFWLGNEASFW